MFIIIRYNQPFVRARSPTPVERCQPVVFLQWMVPTDTHGRSGDVGDHSVALAWSSVVDGRPDRPSSRGRRRIVPDVCRECSSKSIHYSKVNGSYHPRTIGPGRFTRRPVWTRRASHPAPSGRPPWGCAKMTWFRYSCEYRRYCRDDPGELIKGRRRSQFRRRSCYCHGAAENAAPPPSVRSRARALRASAVDRAASVVIASSRLESMSRYDHLCIRNKNYSVKKARLRFFVFL